MKKVILIAMLVMGVNSTFANVLNAEPKVGEKVVLELKSLLDLHNYQFDCEETNATVLITINNNNEVIVIDVESEDEKVKTFVINRLNYKTLKSKGLNRGQIYKMPLKIFNS